MNDKLNLSSKPVIVIQGEGPLIGKKMILLRFKGCNLNCPMCDEPDSLNMDIENIISIDEVVEYIKESKIRNIMITGGEPLLYQDEILNLIKKLSDNHIRIDNINIETNGTIIPKQGFGQNSDEFEYNILFSISPKIGSLKAGIKKDDKYYLDNLEVIYKSRYKYNFIVKLVVDPKDMSLIEKIENNKDFKFLKLLKNKKHLVYLMPLGATRKDQIKNSPGVIDLCMKYGYEFSPRLHVLIYNTKKGV